MRPAVAVVVENKGVIRSEVLYGSFQFLQYEVYHICSRFSRVINFMLRVIGPNRLPLLHDPIAIRLEKISAVDGF